MYLDAVLNRDHVPVFNGTEEATKAWLAAHLLNIAVDHRVMIGRTLEIVSIGAYLKRNTI